MTVTTDRRLTRSVVASYAAGSVGTGGFGVLPGLVLAYYLTDTLAVPAVLASVVVLIPKIIDVVINPIIGSRSDRALARTGGRATGMVVGALAIAPLFVLTFSTPTGWPVAAAATWVLFFFACSAVAYSLFQVPYVALPTELTADYHERTRLVATRIVVLAITILVVGAGGPAIRDVVGGSAGYVAMAVAAAVVITGGMLIASFGAARRADAPPPTSDPESVSGYRDAIAALNLTPRFRNLLAVYVVQALASAVMLAGAQYVATYTFDDSGMLTLFFVALVAPAIVVMPLWYRFGRHRGKETGLAAASALFVLGAAGAVVAVWSPGWWVFVAVGVAGVGYAGMQTFPLAMLPDVIDEHTERVGTDRGGALSGLWTACETVGLALGPAVYLIILGLTGFASSSGDETPDQPDTALVGVVVGFTVVPAILVASTFLLMRGLRTDREQA
ncbi:MFS transporter [Gordonia sp. NPDC003585]|uniref:MFS transporter n=1 Tax=Gordonia sp. NPDC003585 TaxID=3154275 RepID=UPI0033B860DA